MISRRDFLKLSGLVFSSFSLNFIPTWNLLPSNDSISTSMRGRIAVSKLFIYQEPDFESTKLGSYNRDQIIRIQNEVISSKGPAYNTLWYKTKDGFVHSGRIQRIDDAQSTPVIHKVKKEGQLAEVTVPFTQSFLLLNNDRWKPMYRLYYTAVFWVTDLIAGPFSEPWYVVTDDLLHVRLGIPAHHLRIIPESEMAPIANHLPDSDKRIEVSLGDQSVTCFENDEIVRHFKVSTGIPTYNPRPDYITTDTPSGAFNIQTKHPSRHMGDGKLNPNPSAYELPGVPWVSFFHKLGYGFHGTYWHNNFGRPMSHGCINMRNADAFWLYRWSTPIAGPKDWYKRGLGTRVKIA